MKKNLKFVPETLSVTSIEDENHIQLFLHIGDEGMGSFVGLSYERDQADQDLSGCFCFDSIEAVDEFADKIKELLKTSKY